MEVITQEKNDELRAKLTLLDGDRKAYIEGAIHALSENKKRVSELRAENVKLRSLLREGLCEAVALMDYRTCDTMKKYNAIKHTTEQKEKRIEALKKQYKELNQEIEDRKSTTAGTNKDGKRLRELENLLEKAQLKYQEVDHIRRTYEQIRDKYQEEQRSYSTGLDSLEKQIIEARQELDDLQAMHNDAILSRDAAQKELKYQDEVIITDRRQREVELSSLKRVAEGKTEPEEKDTFVTARDSLATDSGDDQDVRGTPGSGGIDRGLATAATGEEQQQTIANFEEAFSRIKEATGVSNLDSIVKRFEDQGQTLSHLLELKDKAIKQCHELREQRDRLQMEFEELKYTGETELTSSNQLLKKYQQETDSEAARREELAKSLAEASQLLVQCKAGVEHICDKLSYTTPIPDNILSDEKTDDILPELLRQCNARLDELMESLDDLDVAEQLKMMEDEEDYRVPVPDDNDINAHKFFSKLEGKMPDYNTRITIPTTMKDMLHGEDDGPGDENDILTRALLKKQAQQLVEARNKKRQPRKKKRRVK